MADRCRRIDLKRFTEDALGRGDIKRHIADLPDRFLGMVKDEIVVIKRIDNGKRGIVCFLLRLCLFFCRLCLCRTCFGFLGKSGDVFRIGTLKGGIVIDVSLGTADLDLQTHAKLSCDNIGENFGRFGADNQIDPAVGKRDFENE